MEIWNCLFSLECTTKYAPAYMVYLGIGTLTTTMVGGVIIFISHIVQANQNEHPNNFRRRFRKAKKPSSTFKEEQEIIEILTRAMAEQTIEDEAQGIRHKPVKRKK